MNVWQLFFGFFVPGAPLAVTPQAYQAGLEARARLRAAYQTVMADNALDAVVFPTTVGAVGPIGQEVVTLTGGGPLPSTIAYTQSVVPASYAGLAGLSLPVGLTGAGLPVGLEVDGLEGSDEAVLGIGLSIEKVLGSPPPPTLRTGLHAARAIVRQVFDRSSGRTRRSDTAKPSTTPLSLSCLAGQSE